MPQKVKIISLLSTSMALRVSSWMHLGANTVALMELADSVQDRWTELGSRVYISRGLPHELACVEQLLLLEQPLAPD